MIGKLWFASLLKARGKRTKLDRKSGGLTGSDYRTSREKYSENKKNKSHFIKIIVESITGNTKKIKTMIKTEMEEK